MPILNSVATVSQPPSTLQSIATILFGSDGQLQQQMTNAVPSTPAPVCSVNQFSQPHTLDTISTRLDNITEVLATNITALTERIDSLGRSQPPREMSRPHHQMQRSHHQMQRPHKRQQQPTPLCSRCGDNRCKVSLNHIVLEAKPVIIVMVLIISQRCAIPSQLTSQKQ